MSKAESHQWMERANHVIAGGVNSPARSFRGVGGGEPVVMERGQGAYLFDVDGNAYIDYLGAFGPLVLGHSDPRVTEQVQSVIHKGTVLGTPSPMEIELAETLVTAVPGLEMVRLTTTGTEAVMSCIRLARAVTGRSLIVKFEGAYHGHSDSVLVRAGSGASTIGAADSLGIPAGITEDVISLPFNDIEAITRFMTERGHEVAAILTEPIVGNMGIVSPIPEFLLALRHLADQAQALLIFDEVITAFRLHYGPAASLLGVIPDLYALGKIIGGGVPAGAYGGRRELMQWVAPLGGMFQAGTWAGNPVACASGLATLRVLRETSPYERMERLAKRLVQSLKDQARKASIPITINHVGSGFTVFFGSQPVTNYQEAQATDASRFAQFHQFLLQRGIYLAPSRYEAWFISAAHTDAEIDKTIGVTDEAFWRMAH